MSGEYAGLPGGFVFAFRRSDSYLFRAYVLVSVVVGAFAALFLLLALVFWLGNPAPFGQRALLGVIGIFLLVPLFAPVLVVARRHRRGTGSRRADAILAVTGFGFVLAVYLALLVSDPNPHDVSGPLAPVIAAIDALPRNAWVAPPILSVAAMWLAARLTRAPEPAAGDGTDPGDGAEG